MEEAFEPWRIYWDGLTSTIDDKALEAIAEKMGMVKLDDRRMISQRMKVKGLLDSLYNFHGNDYLLYTLLDPYDTETLLFLMAKATNKKIKQLISNYFINLKGAKIQLRGRDLVGMGFKPGPIFKDIFEHLLEARLNNLVKTKTDEIKFVKDKYQKP